jgi:hypothetical protein
MFSCHNPTHFRVGVGTAQEEVMEWCLRMEHWRLEFAQVLLKESLAAILLGTSHYLNGLHPRSID